MNYFNKLLELIECDFWGSESWIAFERKGDKWRVAIGNFAYDLDYPYICEEGSKIPEICEKIYKMCIGKGFSLINYSK